MSEQLSKAIEALTTHLKNNPNAANAVFRARTVSATDGFTNETNIRSFSLVLDEPKELGGADHGPNPVEAVLAALGSCQVIVYRAYAAALGLKLDRVEVETKGQLDLRGFLNLGPVGAGFTNVEFTARVESPEPVEKIRELARLVEEHCPVLDTLKRPVEVTGRIEITSSGVEISNAA
jgi:uncharacterized OsmC-like protein